LALSTAYAVTFQLPCIGRVSDLDHFLLVALGLAGSTSARVVRTEAYADAAVPSD
jgi:hypothetical protein